MQRKCLNWKEAMSVLAVLLMLATGAGSVRADSPLAKADAPKPLPEDIVTAWKEAGAQVGWLRPMPSGFHSFVQEQEGKPGDLPAFHFAVWPQGRLAKLPAPAPAFGLDLSHTTTDAGLKELAGLKSLQALYIVNAHITGAGLKELAGLKNLQTLGLTGCVGVTDAGLKELAGLKSLQALDLRQVAYVSDAGLKELAGLKNLQTLDLGWTKVTDAGLKELAGLKSLQALYLPVTPVTGTGLKELAGLKSLQSLNLLTT